VKLLLSERDTLSDKAERLSQPEEESISLRTQKKQEIREA
jgi:hypothetical protein